MTRTPKSTPRSTSMTSRAGKRSASSFSSTPRSTVKSAQRSEQQNTAKTKPKTSSSSSPLTISSSSSSSSTTSTSHPSQQSHPYGKTFSYAEMHTGPPDWNHLADNEHILRGYRPSNLTPRQALGSLFFLHNETWNVWSHLLGAIIFVFLFLHMIMGGVDKIYNHHHHQKYDDGGEVGMIGILQHALAHFAGTEQALVHNAVSTLNEGIEKFSEEVVARVGGGGGAGSIDGSSGIDNLFPTTATSSSSSSSLSSSSSPLPLPQWPIAVFILSAVVCMFSSAMFHLLHVVNRRVFELLARTDYVGIAVLIAGSNVPCMLYGLFCNSFYLRFYMTVQLLLCTVAAILGLADAFQTREWRMRRALIFIATGAAGAFPALHVYFTEGYKHPEVSGITLSFVSMGAQYIIGALLYGFRIPERYFFPGKFDYAFASHGIFHILVFTAALTHYTSVLNMYMWRSRNLECPLT